MTLHLTSIDRATDPDRIFAEHLAELEADRAALRLALDNFRVADPKDAKRIRLLQLRASLMLSLAMVSGREPKHRYVIINDCDAPQPRMVCQWVPSVGYCYLDRRDNKPDHDGMTGQEATPIEAFGFVWADNPDGTVTFYLADNPPHPVTATYRDGEPRSWQSRDVSFEFKRLKRVGKIVQ